MPWVPPSHSSSSGSQVSPQGSGASSVSPQTSSSLYNSSSSSDLLCSRSPSSSHLDTHQKRELLTRAQRRSVLPSLTTIMNEEGKQVIEHIEVKEDKPKVPSKLEKQEEPEETKKHKRRSLRILLEREKHERQPSSDSESEFLSRSPFRTRKEKASSLTALPESTPSPSPSPLMKRSGRHRLDTTKTFWNAENVSKVDLPPIIKEMPLTCFGNKVSFEPSPQLQQSMYFDITQKEDFYAYISIDSHYTFAGIDPSQSNSPFLITVAAHAEDGAQKLVIISNTGQKLWKLTAFQDSSSWKAMKSNVLTIFPNFQICAITAPVSEIQQIEENHPQNWLEPMRIAIIYAAPGIVDPLEMMQTKTKTAAFTQFLSCMGIQLPFHHDTSFEWRNKKELEDEQIRRLVANSLNVIFFHDSEEPFDPSLTENLGNVSQSFVVVQPWEESYRVGYYHKMDNSFPPRSPKNYLYGGGELKNFVMTKIYNSLMNSRQCAPIGWLYQKPREAQIREILEKHLPKKTRHVFLGESNSTIL